MNIQRVNSVNFSGLFFQNLDSSYTPTHRQKTLWKTISTRLDPYVSPIVKRLEDEAEMDVVLFFNPDGTSNLKLEDTYEKFVEETNTGADKVPVDEIDIISNFRSPKIGAKFFNNDFDNSKRVINKINNFVETCENYLKNKDNEIIDPSKNIFLS